MFKVNDKVKMRTNSYFWNKGDIGRIIKIDDSGVPYRVYFTRHCILWARETDVEPLNCLMKVE